MKVVDIGRATNNALLSSAEQVLCEALDEVRKGEWPTKKILILGLDETKDDYDIYFKCSGMTMIERIAFVEIVKAQLMADFGYPCRG